MITTGHHAYRRPDGLYWQAVQQTLTQNLESFSASWTSFVGSGFAVRFDSWRDALQAVMEHAAETPTLVTIDEVGYLIDSTPAFPSQLQAALSPMGVRRSKARFVLCGSAFGQMRKLLDAHAPLRGRAQVDMVVGPFDAREAASFWGLESNPSAAFRLDALIGGTPAYRGLAVEVPKRGDVAAWSKRRLLDPQSALFREGRIVVAEDPGLSDQQLFWSVIGAVAEGKDRRKDIAAALGRSETSMSHPLSVLTEAGWIDALADPLREKHTRYQVSEPIVRWWRLVVEPNLYRLTGPSPRPEQVWADNEQLIATRIHAHHLERLAHWWLLAHHEEANLPRWPREVSSSVMTIGRERVQLDIVATESTTRGATEIVAIGEVKATTQPVGPNVLERLDIIADAVAPRRSSSRFSQRLYDTASPHRRETPRRTPRRHHIVVRGPARLRMTSGDANARRPWFSQPSQPTSSPWRQWSREIGSSLGDPDCCSLPKRVRVGWCGRGGRAWGCVIRCGRFRGVWRGRFGRALRSWRGPGFRR